MTLGIPYDDGDNITDTSEFHSAGALSPGGTVGPVQWYPQGYRYQGSNNVRYARASFVANVGANQIKVVNVVPGVASGGSVLAPNFSIASSIGNESLGGASITLWILGSPLRFDLNNATTLEGGTGTDVYLRKRIWQRHPDHHGIWAEFVYDIPNGGYGLSTVRFWFRFGYSYAVRGSGLTPYNNGQPPPGSRSPVSDAVFNSGGGFLGSAPVMLSIVGPQTKIQREEWICEDVDRSAGSNSVSYTLIDPVTYQSIDHHKFAWGMSLGYKGRMTFGSLATQTAQAEFEREAFALANNWPDRNPSFFLMPGLPDYISNGTAGRNRVRFSMIPSIESEMGAGAGLGPYHVNALGNRARTGAAGAHGWRNYAFGVTRGWPWLVAPTPEFIEIMQLCNRSAYARPNLYLEADGTPFRYENYPILDWWGGHIFHTTRDRMGMEFNGSGTLQTRGTLEPTRDQPRIKRRDTEAHSGPDIEHGMNMLEVQDAITTMDYLAISNIQNQGNISKAFLTTTADNSILDATGPGRAIGRTLHWAIGCHEVLGDDLPASNPYSFRGTIKNRLNNDQLVTRPGHLTTPPFLPVRVTGYWTGYDGRWVVGPYVAGSGPELMRYGGTRGPHPRFSGRLKDLNSWQPWEEAIACKGYLLGHEFIERYEPGSTDSQNFLTLAREIGASITLYAYWDFRGPPFSDLMRIEVDNIVGGQAMPLAGNPYSRGMTVTGRNSGATGTVFWVKEAQSVWTHRLYLKDVVGTFVGGEEVDPPALTYPRLKIFRVQPGWEGNFAFTDGTPFGPAGTPPTLEQLTSNYDSSLPTGGRPLGELLYARINGSAFQTQLPAVAIAWKAAEENWYPSLNSEIRAQARAILDHAIDEASVDNGDFNEGFVGHGWLYDDIEGTGDRDVRPGTIGIRNKIRDVTVDTGVVVVNVDVDLNTIGSTPYELNLLKDLDRKLVTIVTTSAGPNATITRGRPLPRMNMLSQVGRTEGATMATAFGQNDVTVDLNSIGTTPMEMTNSLVANRIVVAVLTAGGRRSYKILEMGLTPAPPGSV
ncbi:MAG: hypothetical protein ACXABY_04435 [Candidatus Thorarchaeota archaeon]